MMRRRMWFVAAIVLFGLAVAALPRAIGGGCGDPKAADFVSTFARDLLTYDAERVEQQVARVLEAGDEHFVAEYSEAAGPSFVDQVRANDTRAEARVIAGPALDGCEDGSPAYGVLVSQVVQRADDDRPRTVRTPLRVTLTVEDGTWRVHEVEIL